MLSFWKDIEMEKGSCYNQIRRRLETEFRKWIDKTSFRKPLSLRGAKRRGNLLYRWCAATKSQEISTLAPSGPPWNNQWSRLLDKLEFGGL